MTNITDEWLDRNPDYTCGCGLYVHPSKRTPSQVHIADCQWSRITDIKAIIEQAHEAKRGLRGHFTPTEYNANWRALELLNKVAEAVKDYVWVTGIDQSRTQQNTKLLDALAALKENENE